MNTDISESGNAAPRPLQPWVALFALGAAVSAFAIYAIVQAPAAWRTAERLRAEQIQEEDRTYCEKFRMPPGSETFATCVADLMEIRRRHGQRVAAEAAGLL
jgi:hypothetical protein